MLIDIKITGLDQVIEKLDRLKAGLQDFRGALGELERIDAVGCDGRNA